MKTNISTLIFIGLGMFLTSCQGSDKSSGAAVSATQVKTVKMPHDTPAKMDASVTDVRIANELVCMVNDAFMGRKQFPVAVGSKTYFGCCENCVSKLQDSDQYRYGIDPLTNEKVDKVEAYIVLASEETGAVYYFANEENYKKFKSKS